MVGLIENGAHIGEETRPVEEQQENGDDACRTRRRLSDSVERTADRPGHVRRQQHQDGAVDLIEPLRVAQNQPRHAQDAQE